MRLCIATLLFAVGLYASPMPALGDERVRPENSDCIECNQTRWFLRYQDYDISVGEIETEEECLELLAEIEQQTPGFSNLRCVEVWVIRYDTTLTRPDSWWEKAEKGG